MVTTNFITALLCEARPLIDWFQLKAASKYRGFSIYQSGSVCLVISGVGRNASAAATASLFEYNGSTKNQVWINVGVGGHPILPIGEGVLAHKITDQANSRSWYPQILFKSSTATASILTVKRIEKHYSVPSVYDMEAAGFYSAASRFSTAEVVHVYKVISDNQKCSSKNVTPSMVKELIQSKVEEIDRILHAFQKIAMTIKAENREPVRFRQYLKRWHFTVTEQHQLRKLLRRWQILTDGRQVQLKRMDGFKRAKEVLEHLMAEINSIPPRF